MTTNIAIRRAVLWDLDGTLIDSAAFHWQAWQEEMQQQGRRLRPEEFSSSFGRRNDAILRQWLRPDLSDEEIARISESKEKRYRAQIRANGLSLLPGVERLLRQLQRNGWTQAIATMTGKANLETILDTIPVRAYFQAFVTAEEVQRGKPEPDIFLRAAEKLGVQAQHCIVVEDSPAGVDAAYRAGMHCIAVGCSTATASLTVSTLSQLSESAFTTLCA